MAFTSDGLTNNYTVSVKVYFLQVDTPIVLESMRFLNGLIYSYFCTNSIDSPPSPPCRPHNPNPSILSENGLPLKISPFQPSYGGNFILINSFDTELFLFLFLTDVTPQFRCFRYVSQSVKQTQW